MAKTLFVFGLLTSSASALRVGEEQRTEVDSHANHTLEIPQREAINAINQRKCKYEVQCEGEYFLVDSLQCPPGAPRGVGPRGCTDCDCGGYADCLSMGLDPSGAVGIFAAEVMCSQPKGEFTPWDVVNRGPIVCGKRVDGVRAESQIRSMCESNPHCWGYSVLTDVLYPQRPDTRFALCTCEAQSDFLCAGQWDEVKTYTRVMADDDVIGADEWELEE